MAAKVVKLASSTINYKDECGDSYMTTPQQLPQQRDLGAEKNASAATTARRTSMRSTRSVKPPSTRSLRPPLQGLPLAFCQCRRSTCATCRRFIDCVFFIFSPLLSLLLLLHASLAVVVIGEILFFFFFFPVQWWRWLSGGQVVVVVVRCGCRSGGGCCCYGDDGVGVGGSVVGNTGDSG
ncbi:hypothetical protein PIB30_000007 [Stylosanthes scabra]|uniref:Uncharacterized protein n=1 Tax=Stylosanthes scabra TaxID=79078 RepID=A0ABU6Q1R3_9FABA|nr:hypothetical protein [Stylosanthes scabra]